MAERIHYIKVRVTDKELKRIQELAENDITIRMNSGKVNLSAYIRKKIFGSIGTTKDMRRELKELQFQVRKIGVNINQAVKRINAGYTFGSDETLLLKQLRSVEHQQQQLQQSIESYSREYD